jgi:hypothetical protein
MNHPTPIDPPTLAARFAIPGRLRFMEIATGLPIIDIATPLATARHRSRGLAGRAGNGLAAQWHAARAMAVGCGGV